MHTEFINPKKFFFFFLRSKSQKVKKRLETFFSSNYKLLKCRTSRKKSPYRSLFLPSKSNFLQKVLRGKKKEKRKKEKKKIYIYIYIYMYIYIQTIRGRNSFSKCKKHKTKTKTRASKWWQKLFKGHSNPNWCSDFFFFFGLVS